MRGLILTLQFLTRLPMPALKDFRPEEQARCVAWFPVAGLLVGAVVATAVWLGALTDPWLGAILGLTAWVWVTGGLHLDGLADLADALGASHRDRERFFAVLSDPHLGAFGAMTLFLQLAAKLVLLMLLAREALWWSLPLVAAWARWGVLAWIRLPSLKPGMGDRFAWRAETGALWLWGLALAAASYVFAPALLWAPLGIAAWHGWLRWRLGGMTGDALGAGVELCESIMLLALVTLAISAA